MRVVAHIASLGLLWASVFVGVLAACDDEPSARDGRLCESQLDCSRGDACDSMGRCVTGPGHDTGYPPDAGALPDATLTWNQWGTSIGAGSVPVTTEEAVCSLDDIRLDDVSSYEEAWTPNETRSPTPLHDEWGRCGDDLETLAWRLTNCERLARNLQPLTCDLRLVWTARDHSADMMGRGYFGHRSPGGLMAFDRLDARDITFVWAGENLARYTDIGGAHASWMASLAHRRNILNDRYSHVGVGLSVEEDGDLYITQHFIRP